MTLVTSIPPRKGGIEPADPREGDIARALASFVRNGFRIVSVLNQDEIPDDRNNVVDIRYTPATGVGFFSDRYGPSFADILAPKAGDRVSAVVNADVYMPRNNIVTLLSKASRTVFVSRRMNVSALGGDFEGVHLSGTDALFFSSDVDVERIRRSELGKFQMGAPFWDLVIPLALSFHYDVRFASPPLLLHPSHDANWASDDYQYMRARAVETLSQYAGRFASESSRARSFLDGMDAFLRSFSRRSSYRDQKRAAQYIALCMLKIEKENPCTVDVDFNDPYLRGAITALLETDKEAMELAQRIFPYGEFPVPENIGLVKFLKILFRARKIRQRSRSLEFLFEEKERIDVR